MRAVRKKKGRAMSQLQVKGNVFFGAGPWGPAMGIDSAQVELFEHDGASSKKIWTGSTGASNGGAFQGTTSEWQATMSVRVWVVDDPGSLVPPRPPTGHWSTSTVPDPTDTLLLSARVTKAPYGSFTVPFMYINNAVTSPPIVAPPTWVPSVPAPLVLATVTTAAGTQSYTDPFQLNLALKAAADSGQPFTIEIHEPGARDAFADILMRSRDQLVDYLAPQFRTLVPIPRTRLVSALTGAEIAAIILAVAVLVLAVGAAILTVMIGIAIIYAIAKGYKPIEIEMKTDTSGSHYLHVKFGQ
jgi:hypothetical protein